MAEPYLQIREDLGPAVEAAEGVTVGWPWNKLVFRKSPVAGRDSPLLAGFQGLD